jgi:hypothetical protein
MWKRRLVLLAGLILLALLGGWIAHAMLAPRHRITYENYEKVRLGMTLGEVEDLFAVPPGEYNRHDVWILRRHPSWDTRPRHAAPIPAASDVQEWKGDDFLVHVAFDKDRKVVGFDFWHLIRSDVSFLDRIRSWLHLN